MIRINLLGLKKEVKKGSAVSAGPSVSLEGAKITAFLIGFLLLGTAAAAYHYYILQDAAAKIEADKKKVEKDKADLSKIKTQYDGLQKTEKEIKRQIEVIEALKKGQTGPVELLTTVANTVTSTKTMWLTNFENTGNRVDLTGAATSVDTITEFMRSLKNSGQFKSVEIKETSQDEAFKDLPRFNFQISCEWAVATPPDAAAGKGK